MSDMTIDVFVLPYYDYLIANRKITNVSAIVNNWPDLEEALHFFAKGTGRKVGNMYTFIAYFKERYMKDETIYVRSQR